MQRPPPGQYAPLQGHSAYDVLGVEPDASHSEIDAARKRLVRRLHPDLPSGDAAKMALVNIAAGILLDRAKRADYDDYLASIDEDEAGRPVAGRDYEDEFDEDFGDRLVTRRTNPPAPRGAARPTGRDAARPGRDSATTRRTPTPPQSGHSNAGHSNAGRSTAGRPTAGRSTAGRTTTGRPTAGRPTARPGTSRAAAAARTRDDLESGDPRLPLIWRPPPPGPLARFHARRSEHRRIARARKPGPSRAPLIGIAFFVFVIALCAAGGVLLGYSTGPAPDKDRDKPAPVSTTTPPKAPSRTPTVKPSSQKSG